jgi:hypothetical protein
MYIAFYFTQEQAVEVKSELGVLIDYIWRCRVFPRRVIHKNTLVTIITFMHYLLFAIFSKRAYIIHTKAQ